MVGIPKDEVKRKCFHLLSLIYVFGYWYLPKKVVILGLIVTIVIVVLGEFMRFKFPFLNEILKNKFHGFYRADELNKISGLIWTLSGALLTILLFSNTRMVFASLLYFSFGDAVAALIGKSFGVHKTICGKSLEGSLSCFIVCFILGLFLFNKKFAIIGAFVAMVIEAIPWKLNDNFWMQIINAGILTFLSNFMVCSK
jgi:dolichol kinase